MIDFDGWRRAKSSGSREETKRGFQTGPQAAAKTLAGRLKINPDRKSRQGSTPSTGTGTSVSPNNATPTMLPPPKTELQVNVTSATPDSSERPSAPRRGTGPAPPPGTLAETVTAPTVQGSEAQKIAASDLEGARGELRDALEGRMLIGSESATDGLGPVTMIGSSAPGPIDPIGSIAPSTLVEVEDEDETGPRVPSKETREKPLPDVPMQ